MKRVGKGFTAWKESLVGGGLALIVYLAWRGVDVTPLLLLGGMFVLFRVFLDGKGLRRFEAVMPGQETSVKSTVTFADIGGQEVAKREFLEALDFVRDGEKAARLGIRPLKGILLAGPPGTGKTLLAKAAANYTDAAFLAASGSQFVEMYAGVGAQRVRKIFQSARSLAERQGKRYAVLFIDEIEVLGGRRGVHHSHLEYDQTLNELLVQMDGIGSGDPEAPRVLVVAATNRPDLLDPALLRPGRFDRTVRVDLPDREGRLHILKIHTAGRPLASDVDLAALAKETFGFSGAHLESLVNEAAIHALRAGRDRITAADFREAIDKVMMGERAEKRPTKRDTQRVAYHEAGHALVSERVKPGSVSAITVTPRGDALGYMRQAPGDDQYLYTRDELLDQIAVCLGGAIAE
ncbi:MAG TPA: AAA family ATPase, partial [Limnochordia bacterium]